MKIKNYNGKNACKFLGIKIDNEWVVVDKDAEINEGDWYFGNITKNGEYGICYLKDDYRIINKYPCAKIISASQALISKHSMNLPVFVSKEEQEIEKLAWDKYPFRQNASGNDENREIRDAFIAGYKANQNIYSEDNLRKAFEAGENKGSFSWKPFNEFLQSLNQRKVWLEVEEYHWQEHDPNNKGFMIAAPSTWGLKLTNNKLIEL